VYLDRIITAPRAVPPRVLRAAAAGHVRVGCEVNAEPPNPGSDAFHAALGFESLDRHAVPSRHKMELAMTSVRITELSRAGAARPTRRRT